MSNNIKVPDYGVHGNFPVATDEISGVHYPVYKVSYGADGSQTPVDGTNPLPVSNTATQTNFGDIILDIPAGNVTGVTSYNVQGFAPNTGAAGAVDVWDRANATDADYIWSPPAAGLADFRLEIWSTSPNDTVLGTGGARQVTITGLLDGYTEDTETVLLSGTSYVVTTKQWRVVNSMEVTVVGDTASTPNVGIIRAQQYSGGGGGTNVLAQINAGEGKSRMGLIGIPSGKTVYLTNIYCDAVENGTPVAYEDSILVTILFNSFSNYNVFTKKFSALNYVRPSLGINNRQFEPYNLISDTGGGIFKIQVTPTVANLQVIAGFDIVVVDNV